MELRSQCRPLISTVLSKDPFRNGFSLNRGKFEIQKISFLIQNVGFSDLLNFFLNINKKFLPIKVNKCFTSSNFSFSRVRSGKSPRGSKFDHRVSRFGLQNAYQILILEYSFFEKASRRVLSLQKVRLRRFYDKMYCMWIRILQSFTLSALPPRLFLAK